MNAEQLLAHYDQAADAPGAVSKLREFVLALAVQGKLVPQRGDDRSVAPALDESRDDAPQRAAGVGRMRWQPSAAIDDAKKRDLPEGWVAARVNDTGFYINGLAFKPADWAKQGVPIIRIQNLTDPAKSFNFAKGEFPDEVTVRDGDILVSWSATLDAFIWKRGEGVLNQHIFRVLPDERLTRKGYLHLVLRNAIRELGDGEHARGLVMTHIKRAPFLAHVIGLPPLQEQDRIIAKVDELMALCDQLEAARADREATRDRLAAASLARLNAPDPETFAADARFAIHALPSLTARTDRIKRLRQTILNLAVRGKLALQQSSDEPVVALFERFSKAKLRRKADTGDSRIKVAKNPSSDQLDIDLPPGWGIQSFENLFLFIDYRGNTPPKTPHGIPLITAKNIRKGFLDREPREFISEATFRAWMTRGLPKIGDLFFTTEAPLANVCVNELEEPFALAQRSICLQPYSEVNTRFLMMTILSDVMQLLIEKHATGMTAKGIKAANLKPLPLPIPPLAEQHRIVAKVDELMAVCDKLEASIASADDTRRRLLDALLAEALQPAFQAAA